ncbi:MAG: putative hydro-lyase [Pseudomonadota bacterium]
MDQVRSSIRSGDYQRHTAGLASGHLQCNLVMLPEAYSGDFSDFCARNSQACPLVGRSEPGDPHIPALGPDIDLRTDVPRYNVYREGRLVESVLDLTRLWRDDIVTFALGCSFTFERALTEAGIAMRHIAQDKTVPMFISDRATKPSGAFSGPMVVSMRPIAEADVQRAISISARYPQAHGAPVHIGAPGEIGIADLMQPDWGDPVEVHTGEVPVFWACGVTPQVALRAARPSLCITHAPGSMLITDLDEFHPL